MDLYLISDNCVMEYTLWLSGRALDFNPAARIRFQPKSWDFFQPNLLCSVLCYGFHVVRCGLSPRLDLILRRNGLIVRRNGFQVMMTSLKRGSVTADNSTLRIANGFISNL